MFGMQSASGRRHTSRHGDRGEASSILARGTKKLRLTKMTVAELIRELEKMPRDKKVLMFDGPSYYTPSTVYESDKYGKDKDGNVIID